MLRLLSAGLGVAALAALAWWAFEKTPRDREPDRIPASARAAAPRPASARVAPLALDPGQGVAEARSPHEGAVGGSVLETAFDEVRVRVVDAWTGAPLEGAEVTAVSARARARTGADGEALLRLERTPFGRVEVRAEHPGLAPAYGLWVRGDVLVLSCRRGARIEGRVHDLRGAPLADVLVVARARVARQGAETARERGARQPASADQAVWTRTDPGGGFALSDLTPETEVLLDVFASDDLPPLRRALVLAPAEGRFVDVAFGPGAAVHGVARRHDGTPIRGADVHLLWGEPRAADRILAHAITDAEGCFRVEGVQPGTWAVRLAYREGCAFDALAPTAFRTTADTRDVEVPLDLERPRTIRGKVVDEKGAPVAGVEVTTFTLRCALSARASTAADGSFVLGPACRGANELRIAKPPPGLAARSAYRVEEGGGDVVLRLERAR